MKIAYISYEDSTNINAWSGTIHSMAKYLAKDNELIRVDNLQCPIDLFFRIQSKIMRILGKSHDYRRNKAFVKIVCNRIQKKLEKLDYDIIFSPGSTYVTLIKSEKPIVIWADATFRSLINSYPQYSNLTKSQLIKGDELEITAFENCEKLIFSATWAANSAINDYNIDENKVEVVALGANLNHSNIESDIIKFNKNKDLNFINLLFIGIDWQKKGGDLLISIFSELRKLSTKYLLKVVGSCPTKIPIIEGVTFHGYLDKSIDSESKMLIDLLQTSHYFVLPTKAEAFGIAFVEANSYGLPTFGSNLGGVTDIIENGVNGELIDIEKSPKELALQIHKYITEGDYNEKSIRAFNHYQENFTWDKSIAKVNRILEELTIGEM